MCIIEVKCATSTPIYCIEKNRNNTHMQHAHCHYESCNPATFFLKEPGELVNASMVERISGNGVPAFSGQWLS